VKEERIMIAIVVIVAVVAIILMVSQSSGRMPLPVSGKAISAKISFCEGSFRIEGYNCYYKVSPDSGTLDNRACRDNLNIMVRTAYNWVSNWELNGGEILLNLPDGNNGYLVCY